MTASRGDVELASKTVHATVDKTAPRLDVSGALRELEGRSVSADAYQAHLDANDAGANSAGVAQVELLVNESSVERAYGTCEALDAH
jgi:hypothetical protein